MTAFVTTAAGMVSEDNAIPDCSGCLFLRIVCNGISDINWQNISWPEHEFDQHNKGFIEEG